MTRITKSNEEIWYWHEVMEEIEASGMSSKNYCDMHEIDYKKFSNMHFRLIYKRHTNPALYATLVPLGRKYLQSGSTPRKFAKTHDIEAHHLSEIATHLRYLDLLDEIKRKKESEPMKFVQVQPKLSLQSPEVEHEVLEKQNDIELNITKGVKVTISPNIDSMKIIKIIELLKDL